MSAHFCWKGRRKPRASRLNVDVHHFFTLGRFLAEITFYWQWIESACKILRGEAHYITINTVLLMQTFLVHWLWNELAFAREKERVYLLRVISYSPCQSLAKMPPHGAQHLHWIYRKSEFKPSSTQALFCYWWCTKSPRWLFLKEIYEDGPPRSNIT